MNYNPNIHSQAMQAYKSAEANKPLTDLQIIAKLYGGLLKNMHDGKRAYEKKDLEEVVEINANTFDILEALQVRLNHEEEEAQETTRFLYRFYNIVFAKTAMILENDDPSSEYQALINYIKPVYDRWQNMAFPSAEADNDDQEQMAESSDQEEELEHS